MRIALAGNPNCGKTTLFNALTGSNQYVGNWPGVTVERKAGRCRYTGDEIVDLPGIYSLSPYSMEETIARDYLLSESPDLIINILDGTNLERNLYLTLQLMELRIPLVIAVNMMDEMEAKGYRLDIEAFSRRMGVPAAFICARKQEQIEPLLRLGKQAVQNGPPVPLVYAPPTQRAIDQIKNLLSQTKHVYPKAFLAAKLLEGDPFAVKAAGMSVAQNTQVMNIRTEYEGSCVYGDAATMLADARYNRITSITGAVLNKPKGRKQSFSDKIDWIATGRLTAIPFFLLLMFVMFSVTFGPVGNFCKGLLEALFSGPITAGAEGLLNALNAPFWCHSLLIEGIIGGVGSILSFLPQIAILFLFLSLLEDSGYMARAAFVMDRMMRKLGLSGKSFIPMLMGFGCTTPAVMAARTMENEKDRRLTIMLTPFMSCGARLPIYALFAGVFFPEHQGAVVFGMYLLGILTAAVCGILLKKTLFRGEEASFLMELPPYRLPTLPVMARHIWEKTKGFLVKAGTVLFFMSILIWFFEHFSLSPQPVSDPADSLLAAVGKGIAPLFLPLGFGFWQAVVALLAGLVAKESVVSTLTMLYTAEELEAGLSAAFTPIAALSYLAFTLLYVPCISALVSIKREMNSLKWTLATAFLQLSAAYIVSLLLYQLGNLVRL